MSIRTLNILIVIAILVGILGLFSLIQGEKPGTSTVAPMPSPAQTSSNVKPAPVTISQFRGSVSAASFTALTVVPAGGEKQTFAIPPAVDMQRLVSGTLEKGDAVTEPAAVRDLAEGQEVLVVLNKDKGDVRSILIIK